MGEQQQWVELTTIEQAQQIRTQSERVFAIAMLMFRPAVEICWSPGEVMIDAGTKTNPDFFILNTLNPEVQGSYVEVTGLNLHSEIPKNGKFVVKKMLKRKGKQREKLEASGLRYVFIDKLIFEHWVHMSMDEFDHRYGKRYEGGKVSRFHATTHGNVDRFAKRR